jgi:aminoglycoside phosphotransferase (APT) family kinase protein
MVPGAPHEARWIRLAPRPALPAPLIERIVQLAFPRCRLLEAQPFTDGLRNTNLKLRIDAWPDPIVLRMFEHDASLCRKEVDLCRLISGSVPVPEIIYAQPEGFPDAFENLPPFTLARYVEGISFLDLKRAGDREAIAEAAYSAGETLAAIGRTSFAKPGWLGPGPATGPPLLAGNNLTPSFVDLCLASAILRARMPPDLRDRVTKLMWSWAPELAAIDNETRLVHGDFNRRNLIVRRIGGRWTVAAVLDWEFAIAGSPLIDVGNFLRYEPAARPLVEPHFSNGYLHAGGVLPRDWRRLAQLLALAAVCESLTHEQLPVAVITELLELARAAL